MAQKISCDQAGINPSAGMSLIVQAALIKLMKDINDKSRGILDSLPSDSDLPIEQDGVNYGILRRTKDSVKVEVSDVDVLRETAPDLFTRTINPDRLDDIIDIIERVGDADMLTDILDNDKAADRANVVKSHYMETGDTQPGWDVVTKRGTASVRPSAEAKKIAADYARTIGLVAD
ncbi:MAG: hypothetical protein DI609_01150 [Corynebacterium urealyticum]|uniref:Uncharacterized protein n=1 Tax=Corynebacterium urealyticum TaxID=43771 RepID=A0A2W5DB43_9CORY|nr:MAG: hypothetical protein DI609_01150 [Corynebacterium urealyticum]